MTGISVSMELCLRIRLKVCEVLVLMSCLWNGKAVETVNTLCGQKLSIELDLFLSVKERMQNKPKICICNGKMLISLELVAISNHLHTQLLFMQTWKLFMETSNLPWNEKIFFSRFLKLFLDFRSVVGKVWKLYLYCTCRKEHRCRLTEAYNERL